jgi:hypothetical protein
MKPFRRYINNWQKKTVPESSDPKYDFQPWDFLWHGIAVFKSYGAFAYSSVMSLTEYIAEYLQYRWKPCFQVENVVLTELEVRVLIYYLV